VKYAFLWAFLGWSAFAALMVIALFAGAETPNLIMNGDCALVEAGET
jgi:hypothetical protein